MGVVISNSSGTPIYEQIETQLRASILAGEIPVGQTLPSLRQFAADLRVSVITVTRAYNDLVAEGLVRSEHGRGFVVLDVDPETASALLQTRVDEVVGELVIAARHARLSRTDIQNRLEQRWNTDD